MESTYTDKLGGISLIIGSVMFAIYSLMFPLLLPLGNGVYDYVELALNPNWVWLAFIAFIGILLMMAGFYAVYSKIRSETVLIGATGIVFIELAYLLQACKVTWELLLYRIIASHTESAFLLHDNIIKHDPYVVDFRIISSITILIGVVLFSLSLYRSKVFPKIAAVLIFVGAITYALGPLISVFISIAGIFTLALGCSFLGTRLFKQPA